ncbi:MAG: hypothetical protein HFE45_07330 [Oscillospiraceae bacterium]|jgi:hypothetical protein|nr:hypothetical protein [Oscillospiraceae bacterium]
MKRKLLAVLLCAVVIATSNMTVVYAENEVTSPVQSGVEWRYISLDEVVAGILIKGDIAYCLGSVQTLTGGNTYELNLHLQRSTDKLHWSTIKSWNLVKVGAGCHDIDEIYSVMSGYYYRTQLDIEVTKGSRVIETETTYSTIAKK